MLKIIVVVISLFLSFSSIAQYQISGKVLDVDNNPIELANVIILTSLSNQIISGGVTNNDGNFTFSIPKGNYILQISFIGYSEFTKNIEVFTDVKLENIVLERKPKKLEEVILFSKKSTFQQKVDRLVFHLNNSSVTKGGNAMDALKITPGISVQNNAISFIGKNGFKLMINGRIQHIMPDEVQGFLQSIDASTIKNIEIITNPSSKYAAEGNIGILNVNLKNKPFDNWNVYATYIQNQDTYSERKYRSWIYYKKNKLSLSSNLSYEHGSGLSFYTETIEYPNETLFAETKTRGFSDDFSSTTNLGYQLTKKTDIGIQYVASSKKPKDIGFNHTTLNRTVDSIITTELKENNNKRYHTLSLQLNHDIDSLGRRALLKLDFLNYRKKNNQFFSALGRNDTDPIIPDNAITNNNFGNQKINNYSVSIDIEHPLKLLKFSYGVKASFSETKNKLNTGSSINNKFNYIENTQAVYVSANKKFNDKWSAKIGARLENTKTIGKAISLNNQNSNAYLTIFPTAYITYSPNNIHNYSLNYGKRIRRPRFSQLNPFIVFLNPFSTIEGNPFLRPSFIHNIELSHSYKNKFYSKLYYSFKDNGSDLLTILEPNAINQSTKPENYIDQHEIGIYQNYSFKILKNWEVYNSLSFYYAKTISDSPFTKNIVDGWGGDFSQNHSITLNKKKTLIGVSDIYYTFPRVYSISHYKGIFTMNLHLKALLLKKNLVVKLAVEDLFRTNIHQWSEEINRTNIIRSYWADNPYYTFSISYRVGNKKVRGKRIIEGNKNEKKRID